MADVIYMPNGQTEIIVSHTLEEFALLVQQYMGYDAYKLFEAVVENGIYDKIRNDSRYLDSEYERIADGYYAMCIDACSALGDLKQTLECSKRINRQALLNSVTAAYKELHSNL